MQLEPVWSNIPFHFKKDVVGLLTYKERCRLRRCSRAEKQVVDECPVALSQVSFKICPRYSLFSYTETGSTVVSVKFTWQEKEMLVDTSESPVVYKPGKNQKTLWKTRKVFQNIGNDSCVDFAVSEFLKVTRKLKCHRIVFNDVILTSEFHPSLSPEEIVSFQEKFIPIFTSSKSKIEANVIRVNMKPKEEDLLGLMGKFDEKSLKRIEFVDRAGNWSLKRVAETVQWKNAKDIYLEVKSDLEVTDFIHANRIQTFVTEDFQPSDVWAVIQNFISKCEHGSAFHFTYKDENPDVGAILNTFNILPEDRPIQPKTQLRTALNQRFIHTQRFPMPRGDLTLLVMISDKEVMGTVCLVASVDEEANIEMGLMR